MKQQNHETLNPRVVKTINRDWNFRYDPTTQLDETYAVKHRHENDFYAVALPHTWHSYETTGQVHPFLRDPSESDNPYWWHGWGWYRKHLHFDEQHRGKRVFIECDGVQKYTRFYCNGHYIGEHAGGFTSFSFEITDHIDWEEETVLTFAVSARRDDLFGGIPPMMAGNWNTYGGIYRDVRVVMTEPVYIPFQGAFEHEGGTFVMTPKVSREQARVQIVTHIKNADSIGREVRVVHRIIDNDSQIVAEMEEELRLNTGEQGQSSQQSELIENPNLWSPNSPYLYSVETSIFDGERLLDRYNSPLGFRFFDWNYEENSLYLNGERTHIHGTNRHQEYPWLGDALPQWMHERDMHDIRYNLGHNFIRFCHYTQDRALYNYCDQHGLLVCEEVPCIKSLPFGAERQQQQVVEMIRRDRNHPSIIMWSMGNETNNAADESWATAEDTSRIIHHRHVRGFAAEGNHTHRNIDMENLLRCTVRGWPERAAMNESAAPLPEDHENGQITGTEVWQAKNACVEGGSVRGRIDHDMVAWIYADHGADREYKDNPLLHVNPKGWVDAYRQPKYLYYLWQAHHSPNLMAFVQPHWWQPRFMGQRHDITVYSNGERVELLCGEHRIGSEEPTAENFYTVTFRDVEVENQQLRLVAHRREERCEYIVPMTGAPHHLSLQTPHRTLPADRSGIALLTVDIHDEHGNSVYGATNPLSFEIDGPGRLLAPSEFISDTNQREAREGTMYITTPISIPVRSSDVVGTLSIRVSSPNLIPAMVQIDCGSLPEQPNTGIGEPSLPSGNLALRSQQMVEGDSLVYANGPIPFSIVYADLKFQTVEADVLREKIVKRLGHERLSNSALLGEALVNNLISLAIAGGGSVIADDYNFYIGQFNAALLEKSESGQ